MREILFRGKDAYGNWLYGDLINLTDEIKQICNHTQLEHANCVNPETVGQFTWLTDKNGKRIFEGDIVEFGEYRYTVEWKRDRCGFGYEETEDRMLECDGGHCVVVGNIFDNSELLKRGDR